jgi:hypothetical protein
MINLEERAGAVYSLLSVSSRAVVDRVRDYFTEYFIGESVEQHPDMLDAIGSANLGREQTALVREYALLSCASGAMPRVVNEFSGLYSEMKFNQEYSLENFMLSWDNRNRKMRSGDDLGSYAPLLRGIVEHLERTQELENFDYQGQIGLVDIDEEFTKRGLISVIGNNSELLREIVLESVDDSSRERAEDISSDNRLAREAGEAFLDAYPEQKSIVSYRRGVEVFLDRFDVDERVIGTRKDGGQFREMLKRIKRRYGMSWRREFYNMLEDPIKTRVETLDGELGKRGIREEDRIRFVEGLERDGTLKYVKLLDDEGVDGSDLLLASRMTSLSEEDRKILKDITKKRGSLGKYLGVCRMPHTDSEVQYDARRSLQDIIEMIDPTVFAQSDVIASILMSKMREQYSEDFVVDSEATLKGIREEIGSERNEIRRGLLEQTLKHYELRERVKSVEGMVDSLVVVK